MRHYDFSQIPDIVSSILCDLLAAIDTIDPHLIHGVYLIGSITLNDFYLTKSDVDFVILVNHLPDTKTFKQLSRLHRRFNRSYPKPDLSGHYVSVKDICSSNIDTIPAVICQQGSLSRDYMKMAPVVLTELTTNAHIVLGPSIGSLPISISSRTLIRFLNQNINTYWQNWTIKHSGFNRHKFLIWLFPRYTEWIVLGVARQLYTLYTGRITSKLEAGNFCIDILPSEYHPIIIKAISVRKDCRSYPFVRTYAIDPSFLRMRQTIDCVNYMISLFNSMFNCLIQ